MAKMQEPTPIPTNTVTINARTFFMRLCVVGGPLIIAGIPPYSA